MKNNNITTLDMYLDFCKNQKRLNPNTLRAYRIDILQFSSFIAPKSFPETDRLALENYIKTLHNRYSPRSAKRKIASIKSYLSFSSSLFCLYSIIGISAATRFSPIRREDALGSWVITILLSCRSMIMLARLPNHAMILLIRRIFVILL